MYFWEKITSNARGVCKDIVDIHDELAILARRMKELGDEIEEIHKRWDFIQRSCKHNSDGWSDKKLSERCIGLSGPCQHPENPKPSLIGNCSPSLCPLKIGKEKGDA